MGYHASLARTFRTYLSAEYNLETSRHEGLDIIENAVDNLDSRNDKHKIMDMHNQVFCPPMRFEYLPHMGDEVRDLHAFCLFCPRPPILTSVPPSGVPGQRPAAGPDRAPDALPPAPVPLGHAKDRERGGEDRWCVRVRLLLVVKKPRQLCPIVPRARRTAASPYVLIAITPNVTLLRGSQEYVYTVTMPIFPVGGRNLSTEGTISLGTRHKWRR